MFPFRVNRQEKRSPRRARLEIENLETRINPYSTLGGQWSHPELVTVSIVPDGTYLYDRIVGGSSQPVYSTLQADFNARFGSSAWKTELYEAAQAWAVQTNLNFQIVADNGDDLGSGSYVQGDSNFGDIRIGGWGMGTSGQPLATSFAPPGLTNYSLAGDVVINTSQTWNIGSTFDLFTVVAHEVGHSLGLGHGPTNDIMAGTYPGTKTAITNDARDGIRSLYSSGSARSADALDAASANNSFPTATNVTIDATSKIYQHQSLDITTATDNDYLKFTAPSGGTGGIKVTAQSTGLSLLTPKVYVYNSSYTLLGSATGTTEGATVTVNLASGITAGQTYYVRVGAANTASLFSTGKYAVTVNLGTNSDPALSYPDTLTAIGTPLQDGGSYNAFDGDHDHDHGHGGDVDHQADETSPSETRGSDRGPDLGAGRPSTVTFRVDGPHGLNRRHEAGVGAEQDAPATVAAWESLADGGKLSWGDDAELPNLLARLKKALKRKP